MARYVDGDAVFKILSEEAAHRILHSDGKNFDVGRTNGIIMARDIVSKQPTADVAPVKRGEWKRRKAATGETIAQCSACGYYLGYIDRMNYCPNCGALNKAEGKE
jgi:hypothetical protein